MTKRRSQGTRALLEEMGDLGGLAEAATEITGRGLKVVSIVLDRIQPDPAQPRRVLPESIRDEFLMGHINARQALERWEAIVAEEAARAGRPRPDWKALLTRNPEDRSEDAFDIDTPGQSGPEEDMLRSIVATASTIRHGGQVSPITVVEIDGGSSFRIETGERRFWAYHWLDTWVGDEFDQIQCIVVEESSPWRQAAENTSREGLSAMAMARQLATLLLDLYEISPDYTRPIPNDWYRQALKYRVPRGEGSNLRAALGGIERSQFSRLQALLRLPDAVWELADRYRLEERRLRYVLKVGSEALQLQLVHVMIDKDLPAERVQQLVESGDLRAFLESERVKPRAKKKRPTADRVADRWAGVASQVTKADLSKVADQWVRRQKPEALRQQISALRKLLDMVEQRVED
jgi:hypothetical protein